MTQLNIVLALVGALVLVLGLVAGYFDRRTLFSEPLAALLVGAAMGPVLHLLHPDTWGAPDVLLEQAARLTLAVSVMGVALRLPRRYLATHLKPLSVVLGVMMPLMWLASAGLARGVLGLPWAVALLLGAALSPTDPVVSSSIVDGPFARRHVPARLRHLLSAESGINDGLAVPIVMAPLLFLEHGAGQWTGPWLLHGVLLEAVGGAAVGIIEGWVVGRALLWAETRDEASQHSFLSFTLALALLTLGTAALLGGSGVLAAFAAGATLNIVVRGRKRAEHEGVQETIDRFFSLPVFALLGILIPWRDWLAMGWRGALFAVAVLLLRRLPFMLMLRPLLGPLKSRGDALFTGWFGPIGIAALYYCAEALHRTHEVRIWTAGTLIVCTSLVAHGLTATPFTRRMGRATGQSEA